MAPKISMLDAATAYAKQTGMTVGEAALFIEKRLLAVKNAPRTRTRPGKPSFMEMSAAIAKERGITLSEAAVIADDVACENAYIENRARIIAQGNPSLTWMQACEQALSQILWNDPARRAEVQTQLEAVEKRALEIMRTNGKTLEASRDDARADLAAALRPRAADPRARDAGCTPSVGPQYDHMGRRIDAPDPKALKQNHLLDRTHQIARERGLLLSEAMLFADEERRPAK